MHQSWAPLLEPPYGMENAPRAKRQVTHKIQWALDFGSIDGRYVRSTYCSGDTHVRSRSPQCLRPNALRDCRFILRQDCQLTTCGDPFPVLTQNILLFFLPLAFPTTSGAYIITCRQSAPACHPGSPRKFLPRISHRFGPQPQSWGFHTAKHPGCNTQLIENM